MTEAFGKYTIIINGIVYGLQIGDRGQMTLTAPDGRQSHRPYLAPPLPPQGVLGREKDLGILRDWLGLNRETQEAIPPAAIRGMGGIGKTTLAIALTRTADIPQQFPDGILWTALGPRPTVRLLLDAWGNALGIDLLPLPTEEACSQRLRDILYHRRMLLIVDDVWDVAHGRLFLIGGPECRTLLTTREGPTANDLVTRERVYKAEILSSDAALALLSRLAPDAVFANQAAAARLCERLEYLPLALTLAGRYLANATDLPHLLPALVEELSARAEARLSLLQSEGRLGLVESEPVSLRAILGLSVDRLSKPDQERFAMLATFGGEPLTWSRDAAAAVWECGQPEADMTILRFIQRGLVEPWGQRYRLHALLADYAQTMMDELGL
jgi:hypothetical protein